MSIRRAARAEDAFGDAAVREPKTVGVLGGMGAAATADFFRRLVDATHAESDRDHLHVLIDCDPSVPDRVSAVLDGGESPAPQLVAMARRLESMGAGLLVIVCNTAHAFVDEIAPSVDVPLVDWIAEVVDHLAGWPRPPRSVGVMATTATIRAGLYQSGLARVGIRTIVPDDSDQTLLVDVISRVKAGHTTQPRAIEVALRLAGQGAEAIVIACTELSALQLDRELADAVPICDGAQVVAERVVWLASGSVADRTT